MSHIPIKLRIRHSDYTRKSVGIHVDVLEYAITEKPEGQGGGPVQGRLQFVKSLVGRGQPGFAGFFKDTRSQVEYLVKEDEADTCVLEGSARFASELLPEGNATSVNFARAGSLVVTNPQGGVADALAISVQLKVSADDGAVSEILPWDVIVYGRKRNPKTLLSEESSHSKEILSNIAMMSHKAQWDLACGIFISTVVGDESLHVGQFMAEREKSTGRVVGLTRIDFGARERYADMRLRSGDFRHTTSKAYSSSGQKGKHYVDYLLASPAIRRKYTILWERVAAMDFRALADLHGRVFKKEMESIPPSLKEMATESVWKVLQRKIKGGVPGDFYGLLRHIQEITSKRMAFLVKDDALGPLRQPLRELEGKQKLQSVSLNASDYHALAEWHLCREELRVASGSSSLPPFYYALLQFGFLSQVLSELEVYKRKTGGQKVELINRAMGAVNALLSNGALLPQPHRPHLIKPRVGAGAPQSASECLSFIEPDLGWLGKDFAKEVASHRHRSLAHKAEGRTDLSQGARLVNGLMAHQANYEERCQRADLSSSAVRLQAPSLKSVQG
ncbi:MAG: hypothetical protein MI742_17590 [Desulfobacterales bacterium]|nr:hypothetical protein [Desulfobacterales bacterium]